jgi:hypothetical protein
MLRNLPPGERNMKLRDFFYALATSTEAYARFRREPEAAMKDAALSSEQCEAILAGREENLSQLLFHESPDHVASKDLDLSITLPPPPPQYDVIVSVPTAKSASPLARAWGEPDSLWKRSGLTIAGTGIRGGLQTTTEARVCIEQATKLLYLLADPISEAWIQELNPTAESLAPFYIVGKQRLIAYEAMVDRILSCLQESGDVCVVFYGHPGVFSQPARESIKRARKSGFEARMLPGISAEDNLIADLGIDPGQFGLQSYEATSFLVNKINFDSSAGLILWQVGVLGEVLWNPPHLAVSERLPLLARYLTDYYGADHEVVLYHASPYPASQPEIERIPLSSLAKAKLVSSAILYVPPNGHVKFDPEMADKLGLNWRSG